MDSEAAARSRPDHHLVLWSFILGDACRQMDEGDGEGMGLVEPTLKKQPPALDVEGREFELGRKLVTRATYRFRPDRRLLPYLRRPTFELPLWSKRKLSTDALARKNSCTRRRAAGGCKPLLCL